MAAREDVISGALIDALAGCSDAVAARFVREVCGQEVEPSSFAFEKQPALRDDRPASGIVIGIAPQPGVANIDASTIGSRPDGLLASESLLVLLEFKVVGRCEYMQLVRHAQEWALDVAPRVPRWADDPPPGFGLVTWTTVGGWLARLLGDPLLTDAERATLDALGAMLVAEDVCTLDASVAPAGPTEAVLVHPDPDPTPVRDIARHVDLPKLRAMCRALFRPGGSCHVAGGSSHECELDAKRLRAAYRISQQPVPPLLADVDPMTPYRVLSAVYGGENLRDAYPRTWTIMVKRVLHRGGDRAVLLALAAWAANAQGQRATQVRAAVERVWAQAEPRLPGLEALHEAVDRCVGTPDAPSSAP